MPDFSAFDDATLIKHSRLDPDAFGVLYRRYLPSIYRYLFRRLGNVRDAEDMTGQVFIEALEGIVNKRYQENGYFIAWLFSIARRRIADFYRKRPEEELDDPTAPEPGLLTAIEKNEDLQRLTQLLEQLDEERQELLRMRFSADLSFAQIGQIEGRSEAAVKMMIYRTIEHLRDKWDVENV